MATVVREWEWQNGSDAKDIAFTIASGDDGSVVVAGYTEGSWTGQPVGHIDYIAVKLGPDGTEEWRWQDGTSNTDWVSGAAVGQDGSIFLFGGTFSSWQSISSGDADFTVAKLSSDGSFIWGWQDGTAEYEFAEIGDVMSDGSIFLAGPTEGNWSGLNNGGTDFAGVMLSADGEELWRWQEGSAANDTAESTSVAEDDTITIVGYTDGDWAGENAGGVDFVAVKLTNNGTILWLWQDGSEGDDFVNECAVGSDGSIYLSGTTYGAWNQTNEGELDFAAVKLDPEGNEVWRWQEGSSSYDIMYGVAVAGDGAIFLAGYTSGEWAGDNGGTADLAFAKMDPDGTVLWRWQEGKSTNGYIRGLASGPAGIIYAGGFVDWSWYDTTRGEEDFIALALNGNSSSTEAVDPTPLPTSLNPTQLPTTLNPTQFSTTLNPTPPPTMWITTPPSTAGDSAATLPPTSDSTETSSGSSGSISVGQVAVIGGSIAGVLLIIAAVLCIFVTRRRRDDPQREPPATEVQREVDLEIPAPSHQANSAPPPLNRGGHDDRPKAPSYRADASLPPQRNFAKLPSYRSLFGANPQR